MDPLGSKMTIIFSTHGIKVLLHSVVITATIIGLFFPSLPQAQPKFDALRLENDTTLDVPLEQGETLWEWLKVNFKEGWRSERTTLHTRSDVEQFGDTYFDVPERALIKQFAGLRHRRRFYPNGEVKELIQLKSFNGAASGLIDEVKQLRGEVKFELKDSTVFPGEEGDYDAERLLSLLKKSHIPLLAARLSDLGVNINRVVPLITLKQERRRIYFKEGDRDAFTVTLDIASSKKLWLKARFIQLDIEINEISFTKADIIERQRMLDIQQELLDKIQGAFPDVVRNQTPKVVTMIKKYEEQGLLAALVIRFGELFFLLSALLLLILVLILLRIRRPHSL